jgi:hypothetical protein
VTTRTAKVSPLMEYCSGAVESLTAQFAMTKVLGHAATAGAARESLIQNFLINHLPEMNSVVSGVIVDAKGKRSKQQDIVLLAGSMPRLRFASGHDLIFQEGAMATFEIKTSIKGKATIKEIGENIRSVRKLTSSSLAGVRFGELSWPHGRILAVVVTYDGAALATIASWLNDVPETDKPDIYLDLSKGILLKNEGIFEDVRDDDTQFIVVEGAPLGLARFLAILANIAGIIQTREVKWNEYIG